MFTIGAFSESQDPAGVTVPIAAVNDQSLRTEGDNIVVPQMNKMIGCAIMAGTTGVYGRVTSPSIRAVNPFYIDPIELALYPDGDHHCKIFPESPVELTEFEEIQVEINSDPAAAERNAAILWFSDSGITPVSGKMYNVRASITAALTAGTWVYSELTFADKLPVRDYKIVGCRVQADKAVAARFVFKAGEQYRPGALCVANAEVNENKMFRFGNMGVWGVFNTVNPPGVEIIGSEAVAAATYSVILDLII